MQRVRPEVNVLIQDRRLIESCDEGAARKFARVEQAGLHRRDRKIPSLHLSWRQPITVIELNSEEDRLLVAAGYDVKIGDDAPYVMALERRFRHRFVGFANGGWCISTSEKGDNLNDLSPSEHIIIPTLDLPPEAGMVIGIHDVFRTLRDDLKKHGIFPEFFPLQERMFQILAVLVEDARRDIPKLTDSPHALPREAPMGSVSIASGDR